MIVRNRMKAPVITATPGQSLDEARALLHKHGIRQLPVVQKNRVVGIITDRDLRSAGNSARTVGEVMTPKPMTISPEAAIDDVARTIRSRKLGALPVVQDGKLVGIISAMDLLDAFIDLSGVGKPTYRLVVSGAKGKPSEQKVRQIVNSSQAMVNWLHPDSRDPSKLHLRLTARRIGDVLTGLEAAGFDVDTVIAPSASRA